jgi:hypothetical protein
MVRRKPKFTPDANNIILFGPGVIDVVKAKSKSAINVSIVILSPDTSDYGSFFAKASRYSEWKSSQVLMDRRIRWLV